MNCLELSVLLKQISEDPNHKEKQIEKITAINHDADGKSNEVIISFSFSEAAFKLFYKAIPCWKELPRDLD